jgi:hypothetical protein
MPSGKGLLLACYREALRGGKQDAVGASTAASEGLGAASNVATAARERAAAYRALLRASADPKRAFARIKAIVLEGKALAKARMYEAYAAAQLPMRHYARPRRVCHTEGSTTAAAGPGGAANVSTSPGSNVAKARELGEGSIQACELTPQQAATLYGSDGPARVSCLATRSAYAAGLAWKCMPNSLRTLVHAQQ